MSMQLDFTPHITIVDDDIHFCRMLVLRLQDRFQYALTSFVTDAVPPQKADIYILDNDFGGAYEGAKMAEKLRELAPESLVIVFSGSLDQETLKRLVNCHAAAVFDKGDPDAVDQLFDKIEAYLADRAAPATDNQTYSMVGELVALFGAWNEKISDQAR